MHQLSPLSRLAHTVAAARELLPLPWGAVAATGMPPTLRTDARTAGVDLDASEGTDDGRPAMVLSEDIRNLLGIAPGHGVRRSADEDTDMYAGDEADSEPEPADFSPLGLRLFNDGVEMLDRNTEQVRTWLRTDDAEARLQARGVTVPGVETQLQYHSGRVMKIIQEAALEERAAFPLVPSADYLFANAFRDAELAAFLPPRAAPPATEPAGTTANTAASTPAANAEATTTQAAATTAATSTTAVSTAAPSGRPVDMALRRQALGILQKFEASYFRLLPQLYAPSHVHVLSTLIGGEVAYTDARLLAATFPCALSIGFSRSSERLTASYPRGTREGTHVNRAILRDQETLVARDIGTYKVRISTDRRNWQTLNIYTDDAVEAAKLEAWGRILKAVSDLYRYALAHTVAWQP